MPLSSENTMSGRSKEYWAQYAADTARHVHRYKPIPNIPLGRKRHASIAADGNVEIHGMGHSVYIAARDIVLLAAKIRRAKLARPPRGKVFWPEAK